MAYTAADIPGKVDVIINGEGYMLHEPLVGQPFGLNRATYGISPTFVQRTNIQGNYGDNFQDFWMTFAQNDWSLGEQQRYFRANDEESIRRYWAGYKVDVKTAGQVKLRQEIRTVTPTGTVLSSGIYGSSSSLAFLYMTSSNLYQMTAEGTNTDLGAHGGTIDVASPQAIIADWSGDVYLGGATTVRKWNGSTFSAFSATGSRRLAFLNNTLYGTVTNTLYQFDTGGVATAIATLKGADGAGVTTRPHLGRIVPYGGVLLWLWASGPNGPEIYVWDGTGISLLFHLPSDTVGLSMCVAFGVLFISALLFRPRSAGSGYEYRQVVYYYVNSQINPLWEEPTVYTGNATFPEDGLGSEVVAFDQGVCWVNPATGYLMYYNIASGGVHTIADTSTGSSATTLVATRTAMMLNSATKIFPNGTALATTGYFYTSLYDGDSSLTKRFKSIRWDGELNGGTVDLAYQIDSVDGSWTNVQTGAQPGTEYNLAGTVTGRAIAMRVTLNRASATVSPTVRRIGARAAPILDTFDLRKYVLNLGGRDGEQMIKRRDGTIHDKDGQTMATDLMTAATSTTPITVIDRLGTITTAIIDTDGFEIQEVKPEVYVAVVSVREV